MAAKKSTSKATPAANAASAAAPTSAEQAALAAAAAPGEQQGNLPPGSSNDTASSEQFKWRLLIVADDRVGAYIELLRYEGGEVTVGRLSEPMLRHVAEIIEVDHAELQVDELALLIEAKIGTAVLAEALPPAQATATPIGDGSAAPAGGNATDAVGDLNQGDDGDIEGLWITSVPAGGFRRCGFSFTREGVGIALFALTPEQIEQLENEPNLKVERGIFSGRVEVQE